MAKLKDKVTRKNLPTGQDGEALVLDSNSPDGLRWAPGIDRLITDIAPELAGDLDASDYSITGINDLEFTDVEGEIAGIENQNLLDKTAAESISGVYTHDANIVMSDNSITGIDTLQFTDAAGTVAGIQNGNLVDKSATETIGGAWTYGDAIAMDDNKITGLGDPTADQDAATKTYVDTQHAGYLSASKGWVAGWNFDTADPPLHHIHTARRNVVRGDVLVDCQCGSRPKRLGRIRWRVLVHRCLRRRHASVRCQLVIHGLVFDELGLHRNHWQGRQKTISGHLLGCGWFH